MYNLVVLYLWTYHLEDQEQILTESALFGALKKNCEKIRNPQFLLKKEIRLNQRKNFFRKEQQESDF